MHWILAVLGTRGRSGPNPSCYIYFQSLPEQLAMRVVPESTFRQDAETVAAEAGAGHHHLMAIFL